MDTSKSWRRCEAWADGVTHTQREREEWSQWSWLSRPERDFFWPVGVMRFFFPLNESVHSPILTRIPFFPFDVTPYLSLALSMQLGTPRKDANSWSSSWLQAKKNPLCWFLRDVGWTELTDCFFLSLSEQIKVSVNDFIIKAAAVTLKVSIVENHFYCSFNLFILLRASLKSKYL